MTTSIIKQIVLANLILFIAQEFHQALTHIRICGKRQMVKSQVKSDQMRAFLKGRAVATLDVEVTNKNMLEP